MSKRRYCSPCKLNVSIKISGQNKTVYFNCRDTENKEWFIDTEDKEIQKALEASSSFNVYFYKSHEYDWMEAEEKNNTKVFVGLKEAKDWLLEQGHPVNKVVNKGQLIKKYAELGYRLEFE